MSLKNTSWLVVNKFISEPIYINPLPKLLEIWWINISLVDNAWVNLSVSWISIKINSPSWLTELFTNSLWQVNYEWKLNDKYNIFI